MPFSLSLCFSRSGQRAKCACVFLAFLVFVTCIKTTQDFLRQQYYRRRVVPFLPLCTKRTNPAPRRKARDAEGCFFSLRLESGCRINLANEMRFLMLKMRRLVLSFIFHSDPYLIFSLRLFNVFFWRWSVIFMVQLLRMRTMCFERLPKGQLCCGIILCRIATAICSLSGYDESC